MMKRSQIYLPMEQWRLLSSLSHQFQSSISELIRRALDRAYPQGKTLDFERSLRRIAGLWKSRKEIPPTRAYLRGLRGGARLKRLYPKTHA